MRRSAVFIGSGLACVALASAVPATAPQTPAQRPPVFTSGVDVVRLDVSALDKNHQPVRGLTADDFVVKEDGKMQKIVAFQEVDIPDPPIPPVPWVRDVTPDVTTNTIEESRLVVIVIDDALIPTDPRITKSTKDILTGVINKLSPTDYTAIVFTADGRKAQDFTHDRATLLAAAGKFTGGIAAYTFGYESLTQPPPPPPQVDADAHYYEGSIRTLTNISDYLIAASQRRKALVWVSPGVPVDPTESAPRAAADLAGGGANAPGISDHEIMVRLLDETRDLFRRAQRANVVIYPIDPTGLGGLEAYITAHKPHYEPVEVPHQKATLSLDFVEMAAANTGGHAIVNTNDFGPGIDQIFRENSSYYLIGFQPINTKRDGSLRRIDVQVTQPGVEVRTRSGYYTDKPDQRVTKGSPAQVALSKAIAGMLPEADLPMGVTVAPFAIPGSRLAMVAVALGIRQPVPAAAASARITETTDLQVSAFTPEGDARGTQRHTAKIVIRPGATGDAEYEVLGRIDLAPGRYRLRLAAHDEGTSKTGSVAADIVIPDFANDAFSMSGVVVSVSPSRPSTSKELLSSILPVVPTAAREFAVTDDARAFVQFYQSNRKPMGNVSLAIRIADTRGGTPVSETQSIGIDKFSTAEPAAQPQLGAAPSNPLARGRASQPDTTKSDPFANTWLRTADFRYALPLKRLAPGPHLLTLEATIGATTLRRDVRFSVK